MNRVLIDTDVVSYLFKNDTRSELYRSVLLGKLILLSFMTVAELHYGAVKDSWGSERQKKLRDWIRNNFVVVPYNDELCREWARVRCESESCGRPISHADAWIAATASLLQIPLITHNAKHFEVLSCVRVLTVQDAELFPDG